MTSVRRHIGWLEGAVLALLAGVLAAPWLGLGPLAGALINVVFVLAACAAGVKYARIGIRQAIWRLRNRLIVVYAFIALVPIFLLSVLAMLATWEMSGQTAVHLITGEFDRRVNDLAWLAGSIAKAPPARRAALLEEGSLAEDRFPGLTVLVEDRQPFRYPPDTTVAPPPAAWGNANGLVTRGQMLYAWARVARGQTLVTVSAPLTREFLRALVPGLGQVSLVSFGVSSSPQHAMRLHGGGDDPPLPPAASRFDMELFWGVPVRVAAWEDPDRTENALFSVRYRLSSVLRIVFGQKGDLEQSWQFTAIVFCAGLFLLVELVALVIGVSLTRTITGAVHHLYDGTERVKEGDFSHRIAVNGTDQLASLTGSFNSMTENLERLLKVAKEKERIQADLEIAREVQSQLYPRTVPQVEGLQITALRQPARMVSGDYYDYPQLAPDKLAIAMGDVAGKGISAALLMATLQSSVRAQIRSSLELARSVSAHEPVGCALSTSDLVAKLNQQLHADTAPEKYATFFFGVYDAATGGLTYTNAGHLAPILVRDGVASRLGVDGMVVGLFPKAPYGESRLDLLPGDLLVLFTDGVSEPENEYEEMFGEDRLIDLVTRNAHLPDEEIGQMVKEAVEHWTGSSEWQDDFTMLLVRRTRP